MSRIIAIADVHGCFDQLKDLIENQIKFSYPDDTLIFLGDLIDRGPKSFEVFSLVSTLKAAFHGDWTLEVAEPGEDPVSIIKPSYFSEGDDEWNGYMPIEEAAKIIAIESLKFLEQRRNEKSQKKD